MTGYGVTTLVSSARVSKDFVGYSGYSYITYYVTSYLNQSSLHPWFKTSHHLLSPFPGTQPIWIHSLQYLQTGRKFMESAKLWFCAWDLCAHPSDWNFTHTQNVRKWVELHALQSVFERYHHPWDVCECANEWLIQPASGPTPSSFW